jgi:hypothetical protein
MFQVGDRITLLRIDDMMALSHRYELEIRQVIDPPQAVGYQERERRVAAVRQRGKRKEFYLDLDGDEILLSGWDAPFKTDTECSSVFSGNACYNLVGDPDAIRTWIETKAVLPVGDRIKGKIFVCRHPRTKCGDSELELLYPDIDVRHAVVERFKERQSDQPIVIE